MVKNKALVPSRDSKYRDLPKDVWFDILNKLNFCDIILASRSCNFFYRIADQWLSETRRRKNCFTQTQIGHFGGVFVEPAIHAPSGIAACYDQFDDRFVIIDLRELKRSISITNHYTIPLSMKFSYSGKYLAVNFDSVIRIYELMKRSVASAPENICLRHEIRFERIVSQIVPNQGMFYVGIVRMAIAFSQDEQHASAAHIIEYSGVHRVMIRSLTISLGQESGAEHEVHNDDSPDMRTSVIDADTKPVQLWKIQISAFPLCFFACPGTIKETGFLLYPNSNRIVHINRHCPQYGTLLRTSFSSCGGYLVQSRFSNDGSKIYLLKYELVSSNQISCVEINVTENVAVLDMLLSGNAELALVVVGRNCSHGIEMTGWYVINLDRGGLLHIEQQELVVTTQYNAFHKTFRLSEDGQLLSVSCQSIMPRDLLILKVFRTATGRQTDKLRCEIPSGGDMRFHDWPDTVLGRFSLALECKVHPALALFTLSDDGVTFYYAT